MPKLNHIVLFEFSSAATRDQIETLMTELRALTAIPCVTNASCGPTVTNDRNKGYSHVLVVTLDSPDNLSVYANHELHQKVFKENIKPIIENLIAMDYEVVE